MASSTVASSVSMPQSHTEDDNHVDFTDWPNRATSRTISSSSQQSSFLSFLVSEDSPPKSNQVGDDDADNETESETRTSMSHQEILQQRCAITGDEQNNTEEGPLQHVVTSCMLPHDNPFHDDDDDDECVDDDLSLIHI